MEINPTRKSHHIKLETTESRQSPVKEALRVIDTHTKGLNLPRNLHQKVTVKEDLGKLLPYLQIISQKGLLPVDCTLCARGFEQKVNSTLLRCLLPSHMEKIQRAIENDEVIGLHEISPAALVILLNFLQGNSLETPKQEREAAPLAELVLFAIHHDCDSLLDECDTALTKWLASHKKFHSQAAKFLHWFTSKAERLAISNSLKALEAMGALIYSQPALKSHLHRLPKTNAYLKQSCLHFKSIIPNGELEIVDTFDVQKAFPHSREAYKRYTDGLSPKELRKREERFNQFFEDSSLEVENIKGNELIPFLIYVCTKEHVDDQIVTTVLQACQKHLLLQLETTQANDESRLLADAHFLLKLTSQRSDWKDALCSQHIFMTTQEDKCSVSLFCLVTQSKVARAAWRDGVDSFLKEGTFPLDHCNFESCNTFPHRCDPLLLPHLKRVLHGEQIEHWESYNETLFIELLAILDFLQCDPLIQALDRDLATKVSPYNLVDMLALTQVHPELKALLNSCIAQIQRAHCGVQIQYNIDDQLIIEIQNKALVPAHILDALHLLQHGSVHSLKISQPDGTKPSSSSFSAKLRTTCAKAAHLANRFFTSRPLWWGVIGSLGTGLVYFGAAAATGSSPGFIHEAIHTHLSPTHIAHSVNSIPAISVISMATLGVAFKYLAPNTFNQSIRHANNTLFALGRHKNSIYSYIESKRWGTFAWMHHRLPETFIRRQSVSKIINAADNEIAILDLRECSADLTDADITDLVKHYPNIQELKLSAAPQVSATGWGSLKDLRLEKLYLDLNPNLNENLRPLANLNLQSLCDQGLLIDQIHVSVRHTYPIQDSWTVLQNCPKNVPLHLEVDPSRPETDLALLFQSCPSLENIKTPYGGLRLTTLQNLITFCPQLKELTCIEVTSLEITKLLIKSRDLRKVFIAFSSDFISLDGAQLVESCPNLEELIFVNCALNDDYLQELAELKHLKVCQIDSTSRNLTDVGIEALHNGKSRAQLHLSLTKAPGVSLQKYQELKAESQKNREALSLKDLLLKNTEEFPNLFLDLVTLLSFNRLNLKTYFTSVSDAFMTNLMNGLGIEANKKTKLSIENFLELLHFNGKAHRKYFNTKESKIYYLLKETDKQASNSIQSFILGFQEIIEEMKPQILFQHEELLDHIHMNPSLSISENDIAHVRQSWKRLIQNFLSSSDKKHTSNECTHILKEMKIEDLFQNPFQFNWSPLTGLLRQMGKVIAERKELTNEERAALFMTALFHPETWDEILEFSLNILDG